MYFADPKVAVAALVETAGQVLLVRRLNDERRALEMARNDADREKLEETAGKYNLQVYLQYCLSF